VVLEDKKPLLIVVMVTPEIVDGKSTLVAVPE
jgi:hypothetical protein